MKEYWNILNRDEKVEKLVDLLNNKDWEDNFLIDADGSKIEYTMSEEKVEQFAKVSRGCGSFFNEEDAKNAIHDTLLDSVDDVVNWLESKERVLRMTFAANHTVGYVFDDDGQKAMTNRFMVVVRKNVTGETKYGLFVSSLIPII